MSLSVEDLRRVTEEFGVGEDQVRRDHVISHVLAGISEEAKDRFLFYGGTMLSRTWLPDARLSEDVDLMVYGSRREAGQALDGVARRWLGREFGTPLWDTRPADAGDAKDLMMRVGDVEVKFQLVDTSGRPLWPYEERAVEQRYQDAPIAVLRVPTRPAAAAMKLSAWIDRRTARDLYDLYCMAERDMLDEDAVALFRRHGQTSGKIALRHFQAPPNQAAWESGLSHQCALTVTSAHAMATVRQALDRVDALGVF